MNTDRSTMQNAIGGVRASQLIAVAAKLRLADHLATGPKSVRDLAQATGSQEDSLYRVLRTLAAWGYLRSTTVVVSA
jgi:DNA-binding IscR family transcriptional regulator